MLKKFSVVVTLVLAVALTAGVTAGPAQAKWTPQGGALFNVPVPWGRYLANYRIVRAVENAIIHTKGPTKAYPNPTIHVSTYLLDRPRSVDTLIAACRRGVSVRVILDQDITGKQARRLIRVLNADNVRDRNHDGKADKKAKRGPCDTKLKKKKKPKGDRGGKHQAGKGGKGSKAGKGAKAGRGGPKGRAHRAHRAHGRHASAGMRFPRERAQTRAEARADARAEARAEARTQRVHSKPLTAEAALRSVNRPTPTPVTWGRDRSYVKRCKGSCRGSRGGNMHSKFYLFSRTGKDQDVVMVSSSNLNKGGATLGWNDMYTMKNRPKTYRAFVKIHRQMTNDRKAGVGKVQVVDGPYTSRFFPMKAAGMRKDPTLRDLQRVGCRSALGPTKVYVSMFYWKGSRGNYLATRLLNLARKGCKVNIIYGAPSIQMATRLREAARRHLINLYDSRWDRDFDGFNEVRVHSKYVLIRGTFGKDRNARRVLTGSQNWVAGSLRKGDETTLNIARKKAYQQYVKHWNIVRKHSRRLPYHW